MVERAPLLPLSMNGFVHSERRSSPEIASPTRRACSEDLTYTQSGGYPLLCVIPTISIRRSCGGGLPPIFVVPGELRLQVRPLSDENVTDAIITPSGTLTKSGIGTTLTASSCALCLHGHRGSWCGSPQRVPGDSPDQGILYTGTSSTIDVDGGVELRKTSGDWDGTLKLGRGAMTAGAPGCNSRPWWGTQCRWAVILQLPLRN